MAVAKDSHWHNSTLFVDTFHAGVIDNDTVIGDPFFHGAYSYTKQKQDESML